MRNRTAGLAIAGALGLTALVGGLVAGPASANTPVASAGHRGAARNAGVGHALDSLVSDGTLTADQASKVRAAIRKVKAERPGPADTGRAGRRHEGVALAESAKFLKMPEPDLLKALQAGSSLADVAKSKGVSEDALVTSLVDTGRARIEAAVTAGTLTREKADVRLAKLEAGVRRAVEHKGVRGQVGPGHAQQG